MTVYVIGAFTITDEKLFGEYQAAAGATAAAHHIVPLAIDSNPRLLEGMLPGKQIGVLQFTSREAAMAWYNSPEYTKVRAIRQQSAETHFLLVVEGLS